MFLNHSVSWSWWWQLWSMLLLLLNWPLPGTLSALSTSRKNIQAKYIGWNRGWSLHFCTWILRHLLGGFKFQLHILYMYIYIYRERERERERERLWRFQIYKSYISYSPSRIRQWYAMKHVQRWSCLPICAEASSSTEELGHQLSSDLLLEALRWDFFFMWELVLFSRNISYYPPVIKQKNG